MGPRIEPVAAGMSRPTWSVMIPTHHCARLLTTTLGSVLSQDLGPENMQIEVIDDCSTRDDPEAVVREIGGGRVAFFRQPRNVGATNNFNTCVARSVGHLVHILHGDDWVMPSFYDKVELAARRHPEIAFFSTRAYWVDEVGNIDTMNPRTPILERPGNDVSLFLNRNPFSFAAIVIRRRVFEATGGFLPELIHTADWEMWVRAIGNGGGYVINQPLACYRKFAANATNRLARSAENMRDFLRLCEIFTARYKGFDRREFLQMVFDVAAGQAQFFRQIQDIEAAVANENLCRELARPS